ncbi:nrdB protein [Escherichia coli E1520]|nr:nrdB protein [Escherichia coli E1520]
MRRERLIRPTVLFTVGLIRRITRRIRQRLSDAA